MTYNELLEWFYAGGKPNSRTVEEMAHDDQLPWLIIQFFDSRGGFDHWWGDMDEDIQDEIFDGLRELVKAAQVKREEV